VGIVERREEGRGSLDGDRRIEMLNIRQFKFGVSDRRDYVQSWEREELTIMSFDVSLEVNFLSERAIASRVFA
jgi:hypothetical protein